MRDSYEKGCFRRDLKVNVVLESEIDFLLLVNCLHQLCRRKGGEQGEEKRVVSSWKASLLWLHFGLGQLAQTHNVVFSIEYPNLRAKHNQ